MNVFYRCVRMYLVVADVSRVVFFPLQVLFQDILFPLLCHSEEDEHLWQDDPHEYIRGKYDVFEDLISPVTAAVTVIHQSAKHRKGILDIMVAYCMAVINVPPDQVNPQMKDGSLHVIGVLANILMKVPYSIHRPPPQYNCSPAPPSTVQFAALPPPLYNLQPRPSTVQFSAPPPHSII